MATNYLEQLVAEWYEYRGYFVRRNVLVGKRAKGGHECELDVVAFHPHEKRLLHIEPSMDADSWETRERRYRKKFEAGRKYIPQLFKGLELPSEIEQIAVLVFASKANHKTIGGGTLVMISELLSDIFSELKQWTIDSHAVPEHLMVLRSFQFVAQYRSAILTAIEDDSPRSVCLHGKEYIP
jgi:hypothetical protein